MTNSVSADDQKMKALFKEAIVEVMEENQDLVSSLLVEALEDIGLSRAIEEGKNSESVSREEVFKVLCPVKRDRDGE